MSQSGAELWAERNWAEPRRSSEWQGLEPVQEMLSACKADSGIGCEFMIGRILNQ